MTAETDYCLDITGDVCPMTFVRTKLLVERMAAGQTAEIRLKGKEPLVNVPRSLTELGHEIVGCSPEAGEDSAGTHRLVVRKK